MTTETTADGSPAEAVQGTPSRRQPVWWPIVVLVVVLASVGIATSTHVPFYAISPGTAVSVGPLVHVKDGPSHDPEGEILLTTVGLRRTTIVEALRGWLDPTID